MASGLLFVYIKIRAVNGSLVESSWLSIEAINDYEKQYEDTVLDSGNMSLMTICFHLNL